MHSLGSHGDSPLRSNITRMLVFNKEIETGHYEIEIPPLLDRGRRRYRRGSHGFRFVASVCELSTSHNGAAARATKKSKSTGETTKNNERGKLARVLHPSEISWLLRRPPVSQPVNQKPLRH